MKNNIAGIPEEMEVLQFIFNNENDQTGLEAFQFSDYAMAKKFNDRLPNMTALEILMIMNGYEVIDSSGANVILQ